MLIVLVLGVANVGKVVDVHHIAAEVQPLAIAEVYADGLVVGPKSRHTGNLRCTGHQVVHADLVANLQSLCDSAHRRVVLVVVRTKGNKSFRPVQEVGQIFPTSAIRSPIQRITGTAIELPIAL